MKEYIREGRKAKVGGKTERKLLLRNQTKPMIELHSYRRKAGETGSSHWENQPCLEYKHFALLLLMEPLETRPDSQGIKNQGNIRNERIRKEDYWDLKPKQKTASFT